MTIHKFFSLSRANQQEVVLKNGCFLAERNEGPFKIMLYQLNEFYVEVFFSNLSSKPSWFIAFENTDELLPYLDSIDINDLLLEVFY